MKKCLFLMLFCCSAALAQINPLPAAEVFQVHVDAVDPNTFSISWQIKPHYFLYRDRISVKAEDAGSIDLGTIRLPAALVKTDQQGRSFSIYRNQVTVPLSVLGIQAGETLVDLHYQGCSDEGFCYPPEVKKIKVTINEQLALSAVTLEQSENPMPAETPASTSAIDQVFSGHHWPMILLIFYGFGLLLSFTPCILPMVPVLSGIIVGHGKDVTTRKAFFLSLSYVLSMSVTYAVIGGIAASLGANLQISMQSPWAISLFSLIFILLALSMFGFYEFKLPNSWQSRIAGSRYEQRGGHYLGAAIMGCLSTLILSPCVTAPLIGVLTYIAQSGNIALGMLTLFVLSLGMGTPLLLIGTSAGKWLPETGRWMNAVKAFFGILLIAVAFYLLSRILPAFVMMLLWGSLAVFSGIYSGALSPAASNQEKFFQGIGILFFSYGLLILTGASMGGTNPLQPLTGLHAAGIQAASAEKTTFTLRGLDKAITKAQGMPVMLDFYADWCSSCKIMETTTFQDPRVVDALQRFVVIKVDVTDNNAANQQIMQRFGVIAPPAFVFFNAEGQLQNKLQVVGEQSADEMLKTFALVR